jgi:hypothetical protein
VNRSLMLRMSVRSRCEQKTRQRGRCALRRSLSAIVSVVRRTSHHEYLSCVVYRTRFNKHCPRTHRGEVVEISHASLLRPYKSVISQ